MEDVLDVYQRPLDEKRPLVCLDEASKQLLSQAHPGLGLALGRPERQDSEYVRNGTASLFMVSAPLLGWRDIKVTNQRTSADFAQVIKTLVEEQFAEADKIVLVLGNLIINLGRSGITETYTRIRQRLIQKFGPDVARKIVVIMKDMLDDNGH